MQGDEGTALNQEQKDLLIKLFNVLDENGDGRLVSAIPLLYTLSFCFDSLLPSAASNGIPTTRVCHDWSDAFSGRNSGPDSES